MPSLAATFIANSSFDGSSTPNASVATMASAPSPRSPSTAPLTSSSDIRCEVSRNVWHVFRPFPESVLPLSRRVLLTTSFLVGPTPIAMIPTLCMSDSSSALIAWVVLCEIISISPSPMPDS